MKKKRRPGQAFAPEALSAAKTLLQELQELDVRGEPLERSLQEIRSHLGASPEKDLAIVDLMGGVPTERMARLLRSLLDAVSDRRVIKEIRRSLYRIEQRGIHIEPDAEERRETPVLHPPAEEKAKGLVSTIDSEGSQIVFLTIPRRPKGLYLVQGIVNDTRGLIDFDRVETTKRGFREFYQSLNERGEFTIVEVDPGHCRFLIEQAAHLIEQRGESPPAAYVSSKRDLQRLELMEGGPALRFLDPEEIERDATLLRKSADLFQFEPFSSWFLSQEEVQEHAELIEEAEESRLVLNPAQKEARLQQAYRRALSALFPEERRQLYRRRLEEMAYVLLKEGNTDRARIALAASLDLRSDFAPLDPNPFLLGLVTRSIYNIIARDMEKKKAEPSLIVKP